MSMYLEISRHTRSGRSDPVRPPVPVYHHPLLDLVGIPQTISSPYSLDRHVILLFTLLVYRLYCDSSWGPIEREWDQAVL